jgi:predicted nuclease of predicted toxin-antitoxin system
MSRPRFLFDHDFDDKIIRGLMNREPTADCRRCREVGLDRASDDVVLAYAASDGRVVVSHDVNTMRHAANLRITGGAPMHGLILAHQGSRIGTIIDDLQLVWAILDADELIDTVRFLPM